MKNISIIGAGTMGNGIAHCFAQKGFNVYLVDLSLQSLEKAKLKIEKNLDRMIKKNLMLDHQICGMHQLGRYFEYAEKNIVVVAYIFSDALDAVQSLKMYLYE